MGVGGLRERRGEEKEIRSLMAEGSLLKHNFEEEEEETYGEIIGSADSSVAIVSISKLNNVDKTMDILCIPFFLLIHNLKDILTQKNLF